MLNSTQMPTDAGAELDPNLQLQQQRNLALPADSTTLPPPPPPPLNAPTSTSGTSTNDQAGARPAHPSFSPTGTTANDATPTTAAVPSTGVGGTSSSSPPPLPPAPQPTDTSPFSMQSPPVLRVGDAPPPPPPLELSDPGASATGGLPAGFAMGDPKGADYGASYYNGQKVQGTTYGPDGQQHWALADGSVGPLYDQSVADQISGAANKAYADSSLDRSIASSTNPAMQAVMSDPQWRSLQGKPLNWDQLSPDLQAKIQKVPNLYMSLTDPAGYQAKLAAAPPQPAPPTGPANYLQRGLDAYADGRPVPGGYNALTDSYRQLGVTPGVVNPQLLDLVKQNPALVSTLPPDQAKTLTATLQSGGITVPQTAAKLSPSGSGSDTGNPSSAIGSSVPLGSSATPQQISPSPTAASGTAPGGAATGAPYTPGDVAIGSTVLPNADPRLTNLRSLLDSATGSLGAVDRTKLAQSMFDNFATSTDPAYKLALRQATQRAAGAGRIGSGLLRTSYGDLANQRNQQLQTAQTGFMNDALNGSISDQFNKVSAFSGLEGQQYGEGANTRNELRGERGYQGSLEQQAFTRALQQYQQQQQDVADRFSRGVTLTQLGSQNSPSEYLMQLAQQYGVDPSVIAALAAQQGQRSIPAPPSH